MSLGCVYVKFGEDYKKYSFFFDKFDSLLEAVAFSVKYGNGKPLVKDVRGAKIPCLSSTKKYIAAEATRLIKQINIEYGFDGDHMALYSSKRQINRLVRICKCTGRSLSCYSLILLHVIYVNIDQTNRDRLLIAFRQLEELIFNLANKYMEHHDGNNLVQYIVDCHAPICSELNNEVICHPDHFPDIHRWF